MIVEQIILEIAVFQNISLLKKYDLRKKTIEMENEKGQKNVTPNTDALCQI